jgi:hypothetical protein
MEPSKSLELHYLRREVLSARDRGRVVIEFADGVPITNLTEARQMADQMIAMVNIPMLGPHWFPVERERAGMILGAVLHWDLETQWPSVPLAQATELTEKILSHFPVDSYFLTNVRPSADLSKSPHRWASGSESAELDAGVAIVSAELIGLLWVEDRP